MPKIIHESVASVLNQIGLKPKGSTVNIGNNQAFLKENHDTLGRGPQGILVKIQGHPRYSNTSWVVTEGKEVAIKQAQAVCSKSNGYAIIESKKNEIIVSFTADKAKAKIIEAEDQDETDGTGEPSGDTKTDTKVKNDPVGTKKGTKVDNKGEEKSEEVSESEKAEAFKKMIEKKKGLAGKKDKTEADKKEEKEVDEAIDAFATAFYESLDHSVTFVLYPEGKAEVHGLKEEEIAPFGGTAPTVPVKYSKKAKDAGPNSKVDHGVLSLYKTEGMSAETAKILTGKDFKACGWGTPGKGTGKVAGWKDTGKNAIDAEKKLKAGTEG